MRPCHFQITGLLLMIQIYPRFGQSFKIVEKVTGKFMLSLNEESVVGFQATKSLFIQTQLGLEKD